MTSPSLGAALPNGANVPPMKLAGKAVEPGAPGSATAGDMLPDPLHPGPALDSVEGQTGTTDVPTDDPDVASWVPGDDSRRKAGRSVARSNARGDAGRNGALNTGSTSETAPVTSGSGAGPLAGPVSVPEATDFGSGSTVAGNVNTATGSSASPIPGPVSVPGPKIVGGSTAAGNTAGGTAGRGSTVIGNGSPAAGFGATPVPEPVSVPGPSSTGSTATRGSIVAGNGNSAAGASINPWSASVPGPTSAGGLTPTGNTAGSTVAGGSTTIWGVSPSTAKPPLPAPISMSPVGGPSTTSPITPIPGGGAGVAGAGAPGGGGGGGGNGGNTGGGLVSFHGPPSPTHSIDENDASSETAADLAVSMNRSRFRILVGMPPVSIMSSRPPAGFRLLIPEFISRRSDPEQATSMFHTICAQETYARRQYLLYDFLIYACLFVQLAISAVVVILAAITDTHHITIAILGAINGVVTGILSLVKGQGIPMRLMKYADSLRRVREEIEWLDRELWAETRTVTMRDVMRVRHMYELVRADEIQNSPDVWTSTSGAENKKTGPQTSAAAAAGLPKTPAAVGSRVPTFMMGGVPPKS